jgi:acyl-[acyl carrier protein]--UDP-N-acetylglucosamine O-acyltransferase
VGNAKVGVAVMVGVNVIVGVNVAVGVNIKVGSGVKVDVGVSVRAAAVAVMDVAVKIACSSGEGPQAVRMNSAANKVIIGFFI